MKNDGEIGKEYVRKEISEEQFPSLEIIQASLSGRTASCYLNVRSRQPEGAPGAPLRQETRAFMTEFLLLTYSQTKRQVFCRHSAAAPLREPGVCH